VANDGHFRAVTGVVARLVVHDDVESRCGLSTPRCPLAGGDTLNIEQGSSHINDYQLTALPP
jgi:hypothetical protein